MERCLCPVTEAALPALMEPGDSVITRDSLAGLPPALPLTRLPAPEEVVLFWASDPRPRHSPGTRQRRRRQRQRRLGK